MKKLFIIMTLFLSSFFLFCNKEVKAYEFEVNLDFSLITDDFITMKNTVESFISSDETYSDKYFIYYWVPNKQYYVAFMPLEYSYQPIVNVYSTYIQTLFAKVSGTYTFNRYIYSSDYLSLSQSSSMSFNQNNTYKFDNTSFGFIPIYSNFDILMNKDSSNSTIIYKYDDFVSVNTANGTDTFKTLYTLYEEYNSFIGNEEEMHKEELSKVESFYNVIIEKLGYLGETLVSNYIYLSIIVIFILIFVFKLIFRRFL